MKIPRFDMGHVPQGSFVLIVGRPKSGVTTLILDYLNYNQDLPIGTVFPHSDVESYRDKVPGIFLHPKPSEALIKALTDRQIRASKRAIDRIDTDPRAFVVFDRSLTRSMQKMANSNGLKVLLEGHARFNLSVVIGASDAHSVCSETARLADYLVIVADNVSDDAETGRLYGLVATRVPELGRDHFAEILRGLAERHVCLVVDLRHSCQSAEDRLYWYRADVDRIRNFRICKPEYWVLSEKIARGESSKNMVTVKC